MAAPSLVPRMKAALRNLRNANGANVTITFALASVPVIGLVGAAVDYSSANAVKTAMQSAADTTALMLARDAHTLTQAQFRTKATEYFKALFPGGQTNNLVINAAYSTGDGSQVVVSASSAVRTDFMKLMGFPSLNVGVDSQVRWGNTRLRVALALDVSLSMQSAGKIGALKTAAKGFLKQLEGAASRNGDVYVSVVPFDGYVNVGASNRNQNWVRWDKALWEENNGSCNRNDARGRPYASQSACEGAKGTWKPGNFNASAQNAWRNAWNGCVSDRDQWYGNKITVNYDTTNTAPDTSSSSSPVHVATRFPAAYNDGACPEQILPLTHNWTELNAKIDALRPTGYTNQTIGLQWAFQTLTAAPFTIPPKDANNYEYNEVIILMTDGLNTVNRQDGMRVPHNPSIDPRTTLACNNIKAAGITIYTIQVNTDRDPTQHFLRDCASGPDKFFLLTRADEMTATFQSIGTALSNLRVSR